MQAVILAGGQGTRLSEETITRPKPMVEIGGKPILWHIMQIYSHHGINDFIVCCGYKSYVIKEYFANYFLHSSDVRFHIAQNRMEILNSNLESWRVTLVDTGENSGTGGRLRRIEKYLEDGDFCMTYGDGFSDVDVTASVKFHQSHGKLVTVTAVKPPARFGALSLDGTEVNAFQEKPEGDGWINGGFFVLSPYALREIKDDSTMFEREPMENLTAMGQVEAWFHNGFWLPMDTLRDKQHLEALWAQGKAPWRVW